MLGASGSALFYSTYLGGSNSDVGRGTAGYVAGYRLLQQLSQRSSIAELASWSREGAITTLRDILAVNGSEGDGSLDLARPPLPQKWAAHGPPDAAQKQSTPAGKLEGDVQRPSRRLAERLAEGLAILPAEHAAFIQFARHTADTPPPEVPAPSALHLPIAPPAPSRPRPTHPGLPALPVLLTPFTGRERECATLLGRLHAAGQGRGGVILVAGEPGVGKTRLVLELARQARAEGWHVLFGRAYESEALPPYLPFAEALREYARTCSLEELQAQLGAGAADVALIVPEIQRRLPGLSRASKHERYRVFESVADFLLAGASSASAGLLLCLDDLHWADKPTLLLLQHLARRLATAPTPLLIAGTYRTVELGRMHPLQEVLADLNRERVAERLLLRSFSSEQTARFVEVLTGTRATPTLVDAIYRETEGNAFFLEEVVRHLLAEGFDLARAAGALREIPEGVRQVIGKRLSRLSPTANQLLHVAAVLGDGFTFDVLEAVSAIDMDALLDALDEALGAGVLREESDRYHFTHPLIRQTLYRELNAPRRRRLHHQVGEALEQFFAGRHEPHLAELAYHFCEAAQSGDVGKAIVYARSAGDHARSLLAYEEGVRLYTMALQLLDLKEEPDEEQRVELLLAPGDAQRKAGEFHQAMDTFQHAAATARKLRCPEQFARAALGFEDALLPTGLPRAGAGDPSVRLQEEALDRLRGEEHALRARLLAGLARALYFAGLQERTAALSEEAVRMARRIGAQQRWLTP